MQIKFKIIIFFILFCFFAKAQDSICVCKINIQDSLLAGKLKLVKTKKEKILMSGYSGKQIKSFFYEKIYVYKNNDIYIKLIAQNLVRKDQIVKYADFVVLRVHKKNTNALNEICKNTTTKITKPISWRIKKYQCN